MDRRLYSWALYDFSNTIFSAVVLTAYFPLYLTELSGANWYLGAATTGSMILAGMAVPFLGALSDRTGKTKAYLVRTTLLCIAFLIGLSWVRNPWGLILLFLLSCFFYHASLVFYNSLLTVVAPPSRQGFASGLGTGLGYLGVVCALPVAHWIDQSWGRPWVFTAAGMLFLLFSLPLFFRVPERRVSEPIPFRWQLWKTEWRALYNLVRSLPAKPHLLLFFGGNFFVVDALNTMIFWFMVYARGVFAPTQAALITLLISVNVAAFLFGLLAGFLSDRFGAMKTLWLASAVLAVSIALLASLPHFILFASVSLTGGAFAIAGVWTAGRKVLIELSPPEHLGEYFGIYGLTTKISVVGSLVFSVVADLINFRAALWVLVFPAAVGCAALLGCGILRKKINPS